MRISYSAFDTYQNCSLKYKFQNIDKLSEKLYDLRPVSFNYISHNTSKLEYGLIAEEVINIIPDIVILNKNAEPETIQYHKLIPLLLNEILSLNKKIQNLEKAIKNN